MAHLSVPIVSAFVDGDRGGNPAGVVLHAERFDAATKQLIAASIGLSETAFVSPSQVADFKLEFFTPTRQIAHCGHATIATFAYLVQQGLLTHANSSKETIDGTRDIFIDGELAFMEQTAPHTTALDDAAQAEVLRALAITPAALLQGHTPVIISTGNAFLLVPLRDAAAVRQVQPTMALIEQISERFDLIGFYVFTLAASVAGRAASARMFAPRYGIAEESATGMAAGPLACYLYAQLGQRQPTLLIEQGFFMQPPAPSLLTVQLTTTGDTIERLMVGGRAQVARVATIDLPTV